MTASKPVRFTSPANAWATGAQLLAFVVPVLSVFEVYQPVALEEVSPILADLWQWLLLIVAVIAIAASIGVQVITERGGALVAALSQLEAVATTLMALCFGGLFWALAHKYGLGANPLTQAMVGVLAIAALARVAQIAWELHKYRRALRLGNTATVEALAQSKES